MKNILKSKRILITIMVAVIILLLLVVPIKEKSLFNILQNKFFVEEESGEVNDGIFFSYEKIDATYGDLTCIYKILITVTGENGLKQITYPGKNEKIILNCNNENTVAIDFEAVEGIKYNFDIQTSDDKERTEVLQLDRNRVGEDTYELVNGVYLNTPYLEGFNEKYTRYAYPNEDGNIVPGNWVSGEKPENWYDYGNRKWANIYVETEGVEAYLVWIPRYVYKVDTENSVTGNERMDVKFVDVYNNYMDKDGNVTTGDELMEQGYVLPEAFTWDRSNPKDMTEVSGYWISKYQLSDLATYNLNYNLLKRVGEIEVRDFTNNISSIATTYTYAINGVIEHTATTLENYTFKNLSPSINYVINVTALNANGEVVGSITKETRTTEPNKPDYSGFDQETTYFVYWDENGKEHNEVPLVKGEPEAWSKYSYYTYWNKADSEDIYTLKQPNIKSNIYSQWTIVTRIDGVESYYAWIPRYEYRLNSSSQKSDINFIEGTSSGTTQGFTIPSTFTVDGKEVTGYWKLLKTTEKAQTDQIMRTELAIGKTRVTVKDIEGTAVTNATNGLKFEYYLNGDLQHEGTSPTEHYTYDNLEVNTRYVINIIARDAVTDEFVAAITDIVSTIEPNAPDTSGFDQDTTFYVYWDEEGNEHNEIPVSQSAPANWYDYTESRWANIVTRNNGVSTYFVWIPRYQYRVNSTTQRTDVRFLKDTDTNASAGYQIPEAFTWKDVDEEGNEIKTELPGYWISKYQLNDQGTNPAVTARITAGRNFIRIFDITGTAIVEDGLKYEYYLNGELKNEGTSATERYIYTGLEENKTYTVNIIIRNEETNAFVGAITKKLTTIEPNAPELETYDKETTFYIYYDENGNEHNEIPISKEAPSNWYDYSLDKKANIVTRIDGEEKYYEWIPRYQIRKDPIRNEDELIYIKETGTEAIPGYSIPAEFTVDGEQVNGYWKLLKTITKEETSKRMTAEIAVGRGIATVKDITGTAITDGLKYEYYLDGELKYTGTSPTEHYTYENLELNREYLIMVIARNEVGAYVASFLEEISTVEPNTPDTSGFDQDTTFYVYWDEQGNEYSEIPVSKEVPANWYDYTESRWANIVTRNNGVSTYFVWIPRYQYKLNSTTQRANVRFIQGTSTDTAIGFTIPEAFTWKDVNEENSEVKTELTGYWIAKYQLNDQGINPSVTARITAGRNFIRIFDITGTAIVEDGLKYEYYLNGELKNEGTSATERYIYTGLEENKTYTVNIIIRNEETNAFVGAITKKLTTIEPNAPELETYDKETTFYIYYDENGNEHNEIPISKEAPSNWYDYSLDKKANIVTRIDGEEKYYEWIPRYQIRKDPIRNEDELIYIKETGTEAIPGYSIPAEFTVDGEQVNGYWKLLKTITKEETSKRMTAELASGGGRIIVKDITGTAIEEGLKYDYYLNGELKHTGTSATENYEYTGLEYNVNYVVNIIAKNETTGAFVAAITEELSIVDANTPDTTGFNQDTTFYVYWDEDGDEHSDIPISQSAPAEWYDYTESKWANIVTRNNGLTTYLTWIPRYQYKLNSTTQRATVRFIEGTGTDTIEGYQIPEAFTWKDVDEEGKEIKTELTGYWITKYQLSE